MGYYTQYEIVVVRDLKSTSETVQARKRFEQAFLEELGVSQESYFTEEGRKWYEHEADLMRVSKRVPDLYFCVEGQGEDGDDLWRKHFCNGGCRREKVPPPAWGNLEP